MVHKQLISSGSRFPGKKQGKPLTEGLRRTRTRFNWKKITPYFLELLKTVENEKPLKFPEISRRINLKFPEEPEMDAHILRTKWQKIKDKHPEIKAVRYASQGKTSEEEFVDSIKTTIQEVRKKLKYHKGKAPSLLFLMLHAPINDYSKLKTLHGLGGLEKVYAKLGYVTSEKDLQMEKDQKALYRTFKTLEEKLRSNARSFDLETFEMYGLGRFKRTILKIMYERLCKDLRKLKTILKREPHYFEINAFLTENQRNSIKKYFGGYGRVRVNLGWAECVELPQESELEFRRRIRNKIKEKADPKGKVVLFENGNYELVVHVDENGNPKQLSDWGILKFWMALVEDKRIYTIRNYLDEIEKGQHKNPEITLWFLREYLAELTPGNEYGFVVMSLVFNSFGEIIENITGEPPNSENIIKKGYNA